VSETGFQALKTVRKSRQRLLCRKLSFYY